MVPAYRDKYNADFTEEKYKRFLDDLNREAGYHIDFRIAESPIFISKEFEQKLFEAADQILDTVISPDYVRLSEAAIPPKLRVPNEQPRPTTIAIDLAVCRNEAGELLPQLIEMQAFPSLFCYQHWLAGMYRRHFTVPETVTHLFGGQTESQYISTLRKWIIADQDPEQVVLMEIKPEKQKTRVDFELTKQYLGIEYVCVSKVIRDGENLFYKKDGRKIPIRRIYNRVIFDEFIKRSDLDCQFHLTEDVNVEWVSHPNWFFRISKYSLPFLSSRYVPKTYFLHELNEIPSDLENYVLKPLFSFAGAGVHFDVTKEIVDGIGDRNNYILQRKVNYEPVLRAADEGMVKTEVRLLFLWMDGDKKPKPAISVIRLSRGKMIGVDFNKNKTWVGGSVGFFG
jgi:hypothetical protein